VAIRFTAPGLVGNYDFAETAETTGSGFAFPHHPAAVGGNYDDADETENDRIRLCIDAGSRRTLN